jgi:2-polyprenyl-6-methoxyphenol hydroxylase-like FAD-dependent oxidoreductase
LATAAVKSGVDIVTDSRVIGARGEGVLELENGTSLKADLVIGADGVNSAVRNSLDLTRAFFSLHDGCGRHLIQRTGEDPVGKTIEEWNGGRRLGVVPASPEYVYIFLCCPERDEEGIRQKPFNRETWLRSHPAFRSQLERIPDDPEGRWAVFYDVVARSWSHGHVAILGDAAHAMSPNLGQAACVAMTNAVALGQALDTRRDVVEALRDWERSERPVTERVQRYSRIYGAVGTKWPDRPDLLLDARSALVWALGRSTRVQRRINFALEHFPSLDGDREQRSERLREPVAEMEGERAEVIA